MGLQTTDTLPTLSNVTGRRHLLASALVMLAAIVWTINLTASPQRWGRDGALVVACGLLAASGVAVVLVLVQSSPLGYRLAWSVLVIEGVLAAVGAVTPLWWAGVALLAALGAVLADATLGGWIRQEPPPTPIPAPAVALSLILLGAGPATALIPVAAGLRWLPGLTGVSWLVLFWFVRRLPGREWAPRLATPLLAAAGWLLPPPVRWVWIGAMVTAAVLAWTSGTRLAVRPLVERGHPIPIPPELAPADVLHSAGIDERGRRRRETP